MSIRCLVVAAVAALLLAACGDAAPDYHPPATLAPQATPTQNPFTPDPQLPPATELRVAYINLMHGRSLDVEDKVPAETLEDRLAIIIAELKEFQPDIVGLGEASVTKEYESVAARIARELRMEFHYRRSIPWDLGQTYEESGQLARQIGFEEGEAILVSSRYQVLKFNHRQLNPRTSDAEGRTAFWLRIGGPELVGEIDLYITHLTGGTDRTRAAQAADLVKFIRDTKGGGPTLVFGDFSEAPGSETYAALVETGKLVDVVAAFVGEGEDGHTLGTCCRESVLGEQPPLTRRTDYIFTSGWRPEKVQLIATAPKKRADGQLLYASDHNGIGAIFSLTAPDNY
jgi:endonuclease/exonuclease/phosphatase family metal-dependent hydrolase/predicted small lipoprotein YifL